MNYKNLLKTIAPHLGIILIMIFMALIYMSPVIQKKDIYQNDITQAKGMSRELVEFEETTGEESQWTNSAFGGMPSYQIKTGKSNNIFYYLLRVSKLFLPGNTAAPLFLYLLGFYILLISLKFNKWLALAGAVAFAFSSYNIILIAAGHLNKTYAIAYMAPVIAGVILTFRKHYLAGGILTAVAFGLEITANHFQITYYLGMIILIYIIFQFVYELKKKELNHFFKSCAVLFIALLLAILPNLTRLWTTYEYSKETTRGKSELITDAENQTSGLDRSYITDWSYGIPETMNLFIPNFRGGANYGELSTKSEVYQELRKNNFPDIRQAIKQVPLYWGKQPGTSGPNYIGAISVFLFILGMFLIKGKFKWWLLVSTVLAILLAWGRNFMPFTNFFLDFFPGYNKWRVVSTTLIIANFAVPFIALLTLKKIFENEVNKDELIKTLKKVFYVVGGIALLFAIMPGLAGDFTGNEGWLSQIQDVLYADRKHILSIDAFRSFVFVFIAAGLIFVFLKGLVKKQYVVFAFIALFLADLWTVDKRYLNNDNFKSKRQISEIKASPVNYEINKDTTPNYRVLNICQEPRINPFSDATTSYFHNSIGGYHGAKPGRYQELIENHIINNINNIGKATSIPTFDSIMSQQGALNMLNTKYIILDLNQLPLTNKSALANSWFVDYYQIVENANAEMDALSQINPAVTALVDKRFEELIKNVPANSTDSSFSGSIVLSDYKPNHLSYKSSSDKDKLAVFSEIYYPYGWNAYIDGEKTEHIRANYLLRALAVPAGSHTIEFKFEPRSYSIGQAVSMICSILVVLIILGAAIYLFLSKKQAIKQ